MLACDVQLTKSLSRLHEQLNIFFSVTSVVKKWFHAFSLRQAELTLSTRGCAVTAAESWTSSGTRLTITASLRVQRTALFVLSCFPLCVTLSFGI